MNLPDDAVLLLLTKQQILELAASLTIATQYLSIYPDPAALLDAEALLATLIAQRTVHTLTSSWSKALNEIQESETWRDELARSRNTRPEPQP